MAQAPASTKVRRTKVALAWFYDPARKMWRFAPSDTTHRAEREKRDRASGTVTHVRTVESKGWLPAAVAANTLPDSLKSAPEHIQAMFAPQAEAKAS